MKVSNGMLMLLAAAVLAAPAHASVLVGPDDPAFVPGVYEEVHLYDVYNQIYGTSYTSSEQLVQAALAPSETISGSAFTPMGGPYESLTLTALWRNAYNQQNVGYYTGTGADDPNNYVTLLTVDGINDVNQASPDLRPLGLSTTWTPTDDFGLFNLSKSPVWENGQVVDYVDDAAWGPLHSEADENFYYDPTATNPPQYPVDPAYPGAGTGLSGYPNMGH